METDALTILNNKIIFQNVLKSHVNLLKNNLIACDVHHMALL